MCLLKELKPCSVLSEVDYRNLCSDILSSHCRQKSLIFDSVQEILSISRH